MPLKSTIFEQKHHIQVEKHDIYNIIVSKRFTGVKQQRNVFNTMPTVMKNLITTCPTETGSYTIQYALINYGFFI